MAAVESFLLWKIETPSIRSVRAIGMVVVRYDADDTPSHGEPLYPPNDPRHAERTKYALYFRGEYVDEFKRLKYAQDHAQEMVMQRLNEPKWKTWKRRDA